VKCGSYFIGFLLRTMPMISGLLFFLCRFIYISISPRSCVFAYRSPWQHLVNVELYLGYFQSWLFPSSTKELGLISANINIWNFMQFFKVEVPIKNIWGNPSPWVHNSYFGGLGFKGRWGLCAKGWGLRVPLCASEFMYKFSQLTASHFA